MRCAWPLGCQDSPVSHPSLCYYHAKVETGDITADGYLFSRRSQYPKTAKQREALVGLLKRMKVPVPAILAAETATAHTDHLARHGHGHVASGKLRLPVNG